MENQEEYKEDLIKQLVDIGQYTQEQAEKLVDEYTDPETGYMQYAKDLRQTITVPRLLPQRYLKGIVNTSELDEELWKLGFDTKKYIWGLDLCCYTWNEKRECGKVFLGQERLDKEWVSSGNRSDDAWYYILHEMEK